MVAGKKKFIVFSVLLVALFAHVTQTKGPVCYSCSRLPHPWDCDTVVQCNEHEKCYVDAVVSVSGVLLYTSGCASEAKCASAIKREIAGNVTHDIIGEMKNVTNDVTALEDDIITCSRCCSDGDFCNHDLCDTSFQTPHPDQQYCLFCPNVLNPSDCDHVVLCNVNEFCYTEYILLNGEPRYRLGCVPKRSCDLTNIFQSAALVGRKRELQVDTSAYCGTCCKGTNCNGVLCNQGNTTPNGSNEFTMINAPSRTDLCYDLSLMDCFDDIRDNSSLCKIPAYSNYACRQSCGHCASTTTKPGTSSVDPTDCFYESTLYEGQYSTTLFGKTCLPWSDVNHGFPNMENAGNKCRDPTGRGHPWCFVSTAMDSEFCGVPFCEACYYPGKTEDYTGFVSVDAYGQSCLPWTVTAQQMPELGLNNLTFPDGSIEAAKNYCRDLTGTGIIYCFAGGRLSPCNVPVCDHDCWDSPQSNTDCNLVQSFICKNEYLGLTQCAKTCNKCKFGLLPTITVIPDVMCQDEPKANCPALETVICSDYNASKLLCPKTCHRCNELYPSTAVPSITTMVSTITPDVTTLVTSTVGSTYMTSPMNTTVMTSPMNTTLMTSPKPSLTTTTHTPEITSSSSIPSTSSSAPVVTTLPIGTWGEWGAWDCKIQGGCYNLRFRTCEPSNGYVCSGKSYEILACENNICGVPGECKDFTNENGINGCQKQNLPFICPEKKLAWTACRKSCNLCDACFDYLNCSSQGARDFFCEDPMYAVQYCRKTCGLCQQKPVEVHHSKCQDPVASDSKCETLQKDICICKDDDLKGLCPNYCLNKCGPDYPLTDQLRNCTPPTRRRRDLILSQLT
ncbi:hypothetical protein ACF0H5_024111 [Mactra antiquata]